MHLLESPNTANNVEGITQENFDCLLLCLTLHLLLCRNDLILLQLGSMGVLPLPSALQPLSWDF